MFLGVCYSSEGLAEDFNEAADDGLLAGAWEVDDEACVVAVAGG